MNVLTGVRTEKIGGQEHSKSWASLLKEDPKEVFGTSFHKQMVATAKAKKDSKEVYQKG